MSLNKTSLYSYRNWYLCIQLY